MRRIIKVLLILITCTYFLNVYAATNNLTVSSSTIKENSNYSITATVNEVTAWNVHVNANGETETCHLDKVGYSDDLSAVNRSFSVTCKAKKTGTINVVLSGDITDNEGITRNINMVKTITVVGKGNESNNNTTNTTKSTNNNLSSLTVEGYNLIKTDDNNYTLEVEYDVSKISINAVPEYSKSTIEGTGEHELKEGENIIEVKVKSEAGTENVIKIKVTRKVKETKQPEPVIDKGIQKDETNKPSFNIVTHLIALVIGIVIGTCISLLIKKKSLN